MSQHIQLQAADGHKSGAYLAEPSGTPKAGLVVLQEIFGVTAHIRSVADSFAKAGYLTLAPALFDRAEPNLELPYDLEGSRKGVQIMQHLNLDETMSDIAAAIQHLRDHGMRKVGVVGYCWGGTLAWLSNTHLHPDATVSYYPGRIDNYIQERFTCPAMFHFGLRDKHIPQSVVEKVKHEYPGFPVYTYDADHAFNRDSGPAYSETAAKLALNRTLAHFDEFLAG